MLMALLALENPPKLLSDAFHDIQKMLVRQLTRSREELQYGLKPSLCVERKIEGSVKSMLAGLLLALARLASGG